MLYISRTPNDNGAYDNLECDLQKVPDELIPIPPEMEDTARQLLPWVKLTLAGDVVVAVEDNAEAREAWEALPKPEPPIDPILSLQLAIAELAEALLGGGE